MSQKILVSEVGPRDGLQSISTIMPTAAKKQWLLAMADAGIREIEVGSFVPAKILPQLADTAELVEFSKTIAGLTVAALVPNLQGAKAALDAGADKITIPFSVSETHSQKNLRRSHAQVFDEVKAIRDAIDELPLGQRPHFEASLSTAFGCTIEGAVSETTVLDAAEKLVARGADEVGLSDTTGFATPAHTKRLIYAVKACVGDDKLTGVHLHNTRGLGLANALAALDAGIETLDSSLGGIGGCPFAPGASGNIVTEDLVFMLESMGYSTGIDIDKLLLVTTLLKKLLPDEQVYGFTFDAGLPKGWQQRA